MNGTDLRRQIEIELERLARAVDELHIIQLRLTENPDAVVEKTAAGALLAGRWIGGAAELFLENDLAVLQVPCVAPSEVPIESGGAKARVGSRGTPRLFNAGAAESYFGGLHELTPDAAPLEIGADEGGEYIAFRDLRHRKFHRPAVHFRDRGDVVSAADHLCDAFDGDSYRREFLAGLVIFADRASNVE